MSESTEEHKKALFILKGFHFNVMLHSEDDTQQNIYT